MITKYMNENEELRAENAEMHRIREILIRDHEAVCRENERLQKKLREVEVYGGIPRIDLFRKLGDNRAL